MSGQLHFPFRTNFWTRRKVFSVERPPSKPGLVRVEQQLHELKFLSPPCYTSHAPQSCAWRSQREECPAFLLPCQLHWHFLFCSQLHVRCRHHKVLFHVGSRWWNYRSLLVRTPCRCSWHFFYSPLYNMSGACDNLLPQEPLPARC